MNSLSTPPSYWALLLGFLVVIGPFSVGVVGTVQAIQASADTRQTLGTVVAFERGTSSRGGAVSKPVVEYQVAGKTHRCTSGVATNLPIHAVGNQVTVLYKVHEPGNQVTVLYKVHEPGTAFIDSFFDRWLCPLAFTVAGFGFLVVLSMATIQKIQGQSAAARSTA